MNTKTREILDLAIMFLAMILWLKIALFIVSNDISWQCQSTASFMGENGQSCTLAINPTEENGFFLNIMVTERQVRISEGFEG